MFWVNTRRIIHSLVLHSEKFYSIKFDTFVSSLLYPKKPNFYDRCYDEADETRG